MKGHGTRNGSMLPIFVRTEQEWRGKEGESHIEAIFPLELAQGRVELGDFLRGPSNSRNISCLQSRNLAGIVSSGLRHCACVSPGATSDLDYTEDAAAVFRMR